MISKGIKNELVFANYLNGKKYSYREARDIVNYAKKNGYVRPRFKERINSSEYGMLKDRFLSVTPGLTGYWACNGRSCTTYDDRVKLELYYIYNCCLKLDIKIFFSTIKSVIKRSGAI